MNVSTFDDDLLDLHRFSERLQKFIEVEHNFVDGSLVLALSSKFGSGKTTFLRMWQKELEGQDGGPLVISLNAWEGDYYGDPLFAIVSALIERLQDDNLSTESIVNAAKTVGWFATAIGNQIAHKFTGIDPIAAGNFADEKETQRQGFCNIPKDTFSVYQGRKNALNKLKAAIQEFVETSDSRVIFLVDELDRCRPDYAISYLETIKHIFDIQSATFILAADRQQLENSAKTSFGPNLDFEEYYRKFVHREITLPPISDPGYKNLSEKYINHYLQRENLRICYMKLERARIEDIVNLVGALRLTPRQIQEVFRILGHIFETSEDRKGRLVWCFAVGSIAMAMFKVSAPKTYRLLGTQQFDPKEALDFIQSLFGEIFRVEWWFMLFLTGGGLKVEKDTSAEEIMKKVGLIADNDESPQSLTESQRLDIGQWEQGWGFLSGGFAQIHENIEQISQWN